LTMQTERGKYLAQRNADFLVSYMAKLSAELKGDYETRDEAVIQMFATHQ
ncbi:hydrolase, partial [Salmonella enterica]|nr:hydrolase [Salmonella enterica]